MKKSVVLAATFAIMISMVNDARAQIEFSPKVGEGVVEAILSDGKASVIVAMKDPVSLGKKDIVLADVRRDVEAMGNAVLSALGADSFRLTDRYSTVSALVGEVVSQESLALLVANDNVVHIGLNISGGGGGVNLGDIDRASPIQGSRLFFSVPLIHADKWHDLGITGDGVVVAVIDSGLDTDHDDLADDLVHEACFMNFDSLIDGIGKCPDGSDRQAGPGSAEDDLGHGTNVTGIITSRGVRSSVGVAPDADIVAIKILDSNNQFRYISELVAALDYVIDNPQLEVRAINMSVGTSSVYTGHCDSSFPPMASAINTLRARGVLAFASSMNTGSSTGVASPACLFNVISVGATDNADNVASFTNSNSYLDVMAPGAPITSSGRFNITSRYSGTSQASPHAAGCAALLMSAGILNSAGEYVERIKTSDVQVIDGKNRLTFPRLDCFPVRESTRIASFTANLVGERVQLNWLTQSELNNAGFEVQHRLDLDWETIGFVDGSGTTSNTRDYSYTTSPLGPGLHQFRLNQVDQDGSSVFGSDVELKINFHGPYFVSKPYPNPARSFLTISIAVAEAQWVGVELYDTTGKRVSADQRRPFKAGAGNTVVIDVEGLASGTYFIRVTGELFSTTRLVSVVH